ncbi:hypothetical protein ON010_g12476 [Phytophthora cinnamomi]|nr:hypothetical protein ON010_g12476 [Phytophthora cinnamomi]
MKNATAGAQRARKSQSLVYAEYGDPICSTDALSSETEVSWANVTGGDCEGDTRIFMLGVAYEAHVHDRVRLPEDEGSRQVCFPGDGPAHFSSLSCPKDPIRFAASVFDSYGPYLVVEDFPYCGGALDKKTVYPADGICHTNTDATTSIRVNLVTGASDEVSVNFTTYLDTACELVEDSVLVSNDDILLYLCLRMMLPHSTMSKFGDAPYLTMKKYADESNCTTLHSTAVYNADGQCHPSVIDETFFRIVPNTGSSLTMATYPTATCSDSDAEYITVGAKQFSTEASLSPPSTPTTADDDEQKLREAILFPDWLWDPVPRQLVSIREIIAYSTQRISKILKRRLTFLGEDEGGVRLRRALPVAPALERAILCVGGAVPPLGIAGDQAPFPLAAGGVWSLGSAGARQASGRHLCPTGAGAHPSLPRGAGASLGPGGGRQRRGGGAVLPVRLRHRPAVDWRGPPSCGRRDGRRIAIVDYDVHHGNGTQEAFYEDDKVLFVSLHQDNNYPADSGAVSERGEGKGEGFSINVPLPPGSGSGAYEYAFKSVVVPTLERFKPDFILVSSGFDASYADPLAAMILSSSVFRFMAHELVEAAERLCGGRIVFAHEGGYSETYVPFCGAAVIEEMLGVREVEKQIKDPFLSEVKRWSYQELQEHQKKVVDSVVVSADLQ